SGEITTFVIDESGGTISFSGTAAGIVNITFDGQTATFTRDGITADATVSDFFSKSVSGTVELQIDVTGAATANDDVFKVTAPDATAIVFEGDAGDGTDAFVVNVADPNPSSKNSKEMRVDAREVSSGETLKFVFEASAANTSDEFDNDEVKLSNDSGLSESFTRFEVRTGTVDYTQAVLPNGITYDFQSGGVATLQQLQSSDLFLSLTDTASLTVSVTSDELEGLAAFLDTPGALKLIGVTVGLRVDGGDTVNLSTTTDPDFVPLADKFATISYPGFVRISEALNQIGVELQSQDFSISMLADDSDAPENAGSATTNSIAGLKAVVEELEALVGTESVASVKAALETTVADAVDALEMKIRGTEVAGDFKTLAEISDALVKLNGAVDVSGSVRNLIGAPADDTADATGLFSDVETLIAEAVSQVESDLRDGVDPSLDTLAEIAAELGALDTAVNDLTGGKGSVSQQITDAIGLKAEDNEGTATGLWADIETALSDAVSDLSTDIDTLRADINGEGTVAADYDTLVEISNALATLNGAVGDTGSVSQEIAAQIGTPSDGLTSATGLFSDVETLIDAAVTLLEGQISTLQTSITDNGGDIALLLDDSSTNGGTPTTDSIAGLKVALDQVSGGAVSDLADLQSAVGVADDGTGNPTGLYLDIKNAVDAAVTSLEGQISTLQTSITDNEGDIALLLDDGTPQTDTDGNVVTDTDDNVVYDVAPTTDSIAGLKAALATAQGTGADVSSLQSDLDKVESYIADLQAQLDAKFAPEQLRWTQNDDFVQLVEYDSEAIRVETFEGNDTINSSSATTEIVGGEGGDSINLTTRDYSANETGGAADDSVDTVIYQTVFDGFSNAIVTADFGTNPDNYREGTVLTLTINGEEYSYTVTTEDGDTTIDAAEIQAQLETFAGELTTDSNALSGVTVGDGVLRLVGANGAELNVTAGGDVEAAIENLGVVTKVDVAFPSDASIWPTQTNGDNTTEFTRKLSVTIDGKVYNADVVYDPGTGDVDMLASLEALAATVNEAASVDATTTGYSRFGGDPNRGERVVLSDHDTSDLAFALSIDGKTYTRADFQAYLDGIVGIDIAPHGGEADGGATLYDFANWLNTLPEIRKADVVDPSVDGEDPEISLNLSAFGAAVSLEFTGGYISVDRFYGMGAISDRFDIDVTAVPGETLAGIIVQAAAQEAPDGTLTLTLKGAAVPADDVSTSTFTVVSAAIEQNGSQQETVVTFSDDPADYYEGGQLSVTVAGETVTADMVAGDPAASVAALITEVQLAAEGGDRIISQTGATATFDLSNLSQAATVDDSFVLVDSGQQAFRYGVTIEIGGTTYYAAFEDDGTNLTTSDLTPEFQTTLGGLVSDLNEKFAGKATFVLDETNQELNVIAEPGLEIKGFGAFLPELRFNVDDDTMWNPPGMVTPGAVVTEPVQAIPAVAAALESVAERDEELTSITQGVSFVSWLADGTVRSIDDTAFRSNLETYGKFIVPSVEVSGYAIQHPSSDVDFSYAIDVVTVDESYSSLAEWASSVSTTFTEMSGDTVNVTYDPDNGEITFSGFNTPSRFGGMGITFVNSEPSLTLTAATEEPDPLEVEGALDFAGEVQTATISLEDATQYNAFTDGTDVSSSGRGADVYYENGKAYVTITDVETGEDVPVSADMQTLIPVPVIDIASTGSAQALTLLDNPDALISDKGGTGLFDFTFEITVDATSYGRADFVSYVSEIGKSFWTNDGTVKDPASQVTTQDVVDWLETISGIDGATLEPGVDGQNDFIRVKPSVGSDVSFGTVKFLVAPPSDGFVDEAGLTFSDSGVVYSVGDVSSGTTQELGFDASLSLVDAINDETGVGGSLEGLLDNATYNSETGEITLTAKEVGQKTFEVSDVSLDYQGVQQIATVKLDPNTVYDSLSTGTPTGRSEDAKSEIYYEGGQAHITIAEADAATTGETDVVDSKTVSVTMAANPKIGNLIMSGDADILGLSDDTVLYDPDNISDPTTEYGISVFLRDADGNNVATFKSGENSGGSGETFEAFLARIAESDLVESAALTDKFAFDPPVPVLQLTFAADTIVDKVSGSGTGLVSGNFQSGRTYSKSGAEPTSQALVDAINEQINGPLVQDGFDGELSAGDKIVIAGPAVETFATNLAQEKEYGFVRAALKFETATDTFSFKAQISNDGFTGIGSSSYSTSVAVDVGNPVRGTDGIDVFISLLNDAFSKFETDFAAGQELGTISYNSEDQQIEIAAADGVTVSPIELSGSNGATMELFSELDTGDGTNPNDNIHSRLLTDGSETQETQTNGVDSGPIPTTDEFVEQIVGQADPDPVLSNLLESASYDSDTGEIVLTSKTTDKEMFKVTDAGLDYQGLKQIAEAEFSTDDADYYAGGQAILDIDTTPGVDGGILSFVGTTPIDSETATSTLEDLVAQIQAEIDGTVIPEVQAAPATISIDLNGNDGTYTNYTATSAPNIPGFSDGDTAFVLYNFDLSVNSTSYNYSLGSKYITTYISNGSSPTNMAFADLSAFVAYLDGLSAVSAEIVGDPGQEELEITANRTGPNEVTLRLDLTVKPITDDTDGNNFPELGDFVFGTITSPTSAATAEADSTPGQSADFIPGSLTGIVGSVELITGQQGDTIRLTSADDEREAFAIDRAEMTTTGVKQEATLDFSGTDADYYADGALSVTVRALGDLAEYQTSTAMIDGDADASVAALADAINAKIRGIEQPAVVRIPVEQDETSFQDGGSGLARALGVSGIIGFTIATDPISDGVYFYINNASDLNVEGFLDALVATNAVDSATYDADSDEIVITSETVGSDAYLKLFDVNVFSGEYEDSGTLDDTVIDGDLAAIIESASAETDNEGNAVLRLKAAQLPTGDGTQTFSVVDAAQDREAVKQVTEIDATNVTFDELRADASGALPQTSVTIAGETITTDPGTDGADTMRELAQRIIEARDGTFATEIASLQEVPPSIVIDVHNYDELETLLVTGGYVYQALGVTFATETNSFEFYAGHSVSDQSSFFFSVYKAGVSSTAQFSEVDNFGRFDRLLTRFEDQVAGGQDLGSITFDQTNGRLVIEAAEGVSLAPGAPSFQSENDNAWEDIDKPVLFKDYRFYNGRDDAYDFFESDLVAFGDGDVSFEDYATSGVDPVPSDFSVAQSGLTALAVRSVSTSTLLDYAPIAGRLVYKPDMADEAKFDLAFVPELAEAGAGTGSTVGDMIAYINGIDQGQFNASIQNGALVIEANDGSEISGELSFDIQTGDFAETVVDIAAAADQGQADVVPEDATAAEVSIAFDLTNDFSISGYDIRLSVDGNPEVQAFVDGGLDASHLSGVASSLNAGSEFDGLVTFAAENGELVARTVDTGAAATLQLVSADLVTNDGVVDGSADPATAQGSDAVVGQDAQLASVTLSEFAGLSADDTLKDGDYGFEVSVGGITYTTTITSPDATSSDAVTVNDLPALMAGAVNNSSEPLGDLVDVSFVPGEGLVLSIKEDAGLPPNAELSVPAGSQGDGTNIFNFVDAPVAAVADAVGAVDFETQPVPTGEVIAYDLGGEFVAGQSLEANISFAEQFEDAVTNRELRTAVTFDDGETKQELNIIVTAISVDVQVSGSSRLERDGLAPGEDATLAEYVAAANDALSERELQNGVNKELGTISYDAKSGIIEWLAADGVSISPGVTSYTPEGPGNRFFFARWGDVGTNGDYGARALNPDGTALGFDEQENAIDALTVADEFAAKVGVPLTKDVGSITLTAKDGGDDPMNVTGFETDVVSDENSTEQVVSILFFGDSSVDNLTIGSKITVDILGQSLSYTVGDDATGEANATDPSQFYADKLLAQLEALPEIDAAASSVSLNGDGQTRITLQAATPGQDNLGNVLDSEITVTVERNTGTETDPVLVANSAAAVAEQQAGALVYETSDGGVIINDEDGDGNAVTGRPEETLERSDEGSEGGAPALDTTDVDGQSDDNVDQSVENPSDNAGFYGEAGGTEATQTYTNPDDGFAATEGTPEIGQSAEAAGGDAEFAGDPESTGAGNGVTQTHTNPDSGYDAANASPEAGSTNDGDASLSGSEPGQYVEDGLETDYLSGATAAIVAYEYGGDVKEGVAIKIDAVMAEEFDQQPDGPFFAGFEFTFVVGDEKYALSLGVSSYSGGVFSNGPNGVGGRAYAVASSASFAEVVEALDDLLSGYETADVGQELGTIAYDETSGEVTITAADGVRIAQKDAADSNAMKPNLFYVIKGDVDAGVLLDGTDEGIGANDSFNAKFLVQQPNLYETRGDGTDLTDRVDAGDGSQADDGGTAGALPTEVTDSDSATDDLSVTEDDAGVPAYEEDATVTEVFSGNAAADVITNFQVANDVIGIEGALLGSLGGASFVSVTGAPVFIWEQAVQLEVAEQAPIDPTGSTSALATRSDVLTWDWAADYDGGPIRIEDGAPQFIKVQGDTYLDRYAEWDVSFGIGDNPDLSDGPFDSLNELVAAIEGNQWTGDQGIDIEADVVDGNLEFRVSGVAADDSNDQLRSDFGIDYEWVIRNGPEAKFEMLVRDSELFDLSTTGFGLVDSEASTLEASAIADAEEVAALLRKVFDFSGDTPNADVNTTIFAVTASDDASETAIWAHTQSSADDDTVEALELNLLGTVVTVGDGAGNDEFGIENFAVSDAGGWDILSAEQQPIA
ncbi:MAG: hypothetical protein DCO97_19615, partial [Marivita sp. XM-24bin2]